MKRMTPYIIHNRVILLKSKYKLYNTLNSRRKIREYIMDLEALLCEILDIHKLTSEQYGFYKHTTA